MPELNKANRQVCDLDIRVLKTMAPYLFFDTANTTTVGLSGENVYAMAKGSKRIAFANPLEGTLTVEAQLVPMKLYSLFSDGVIDSESTYAEKKTIKATTADELDLEATDATYVFVYPEGEYGNEEKAIAGTFTGGKFTPTQTGDIVADTSYDVGYLVKKTSGVQKVSFNNKKVPKDYFITMQTVDKDEEGVMTPFIITAYKATIQRNFELSFSSEGDPATITATLI